MIKRLLFFAILVVMACGCAETVEHRLSEEFALSKPQSVAILPVHGEGPERAKLILREITARSMREKNYTVKPLEDTDRVLEKLNPGEKIEASAVVKLLGTDSILLVNITEWDEDLITPYGALSVEVSFILYGRDGSILWSADAREKQSNIKLDRELLKMSIIETYEPVLERLAETVLFSLPSRRPEEEKPVKKEKKQFFDWL